MQKNLAAITGLLCITLYCAAISVADGGMQTPAWKNVSGGIVNSD